MQFWKKHYLFLFRLIILGIPNTAICWEQKCPEDGLWAGWNIVFRSSPGSCKAEKKRKVRKANLRSLRLSAQRPLFCLAWNPSLIFPGPGFVHILKLFLPTHLVDLKQKYAVPDFNLDCLFHIDFLRKISFSNRNYKIHTKWNCKNERLFFKWARCW